jgi:endonuclease/exonuclease/phosphatase family metal-dependent hydrolase
MIPLRLTAGFDIQKKDSATRIMSWNVEHFDILEHKTHPERKQEMLDLVNEYQPDIACFQEMVGSDSFPKAINYIPDFLQKLGFKDYNYSYNVKVDFDGNHHFGIITFSRYPIINKQTVSYPPHDYNSIFQFTDILKGADTIRVFNIHLQSLKFSSGNLEYIEKPTLKDEEDIEKTKGVISKLKTGFLKRGVQAGRIRKAIDESPYPVIVCGDFNDVPNSYAYNTIGQNLQNAFEKKGSGLGRTFTGISPTLRIDNVFVPTNYEVLQYKRVMKKLSDHFPVLTDIIAGKK